MTQSHLFANIRADNPTTKKLKTGSRSKNTLVCRGDILNFIEEISRTRMNHTNPNYVLFSSYFRQFNIGLATSYDGVFDAIRMSPVLALDIRKT